MESFIGTIIFVLPGFLLYFWIQTFGVNPVIKHTPIEFTTIAALLWIPVSVVTLLLHNLLFYALDWANRINQVWSIDDMVKAAQKPEFLLWFLVLSILVSFVFGVVWAMYGMHKLRKLINYVRTKKGLADLSENTSVWDELFLKKEPQIVEIGKIDKPESGLMGELGKVSRTFEPERVSLNHVEYVTQILKKKKVPVDKIFVDVKSGTYVKIFDTDVFNEAQKDCAKPTFLLPEDSDPDQV